MFEDSVECRRIRRARYSSCFIRKVLMKQPIDFTQSAPSVCVASKFSAFSCWTDYGSNELPTFWQPAGGGSVTFAISFPCDVGGRGWRLPVVLGRTFSSRLGRLGVQFSIWSCQHTCQRGFSATLLLFCIRRDGPTKPSRTEHSQLERGPRCRHVDSTGNELDKQKGKVHTRGEEVGNFPTPHNMSRAKDFQGQEKLSHPE